MNLLSQHDYAFVGGHLAKFGMDVMQHTTQSLTVPDHATLALRRDTQDAGTHLVYRTKSLDQFKGWVGNPDHVFDGDTRYNGKHPARMLDSRVPAEALTAEDWQHLEQAAKGYIWGPSHVFAAHKPAVEAFVPLETVVHVYAQLVVNGTLSFNDGKSNVLVVGRLIYGPNGLINGNTNLTVYASQIIRAN
ncbi:hypothetical protein [Corallococcus llansteffanensis]|uniref:Uncharacterized protein n=1 Tax=Corallococcus llansteffanensis TaxID=2316731 RepID=A0A3A8N1T4_9BACT|nr:hypothetical protein [Corallococcus llansteffanensis]RKH37500.1 hypothetical protein D7V93_42015 [Corallococcus llansteffanensis]